MAANFTYCGQGNVTVLGLVSRVGGAPYLDWHIGDQLWFGVVEVSPNIRKQTAIGSHLVLVVSVLLIHPLQFQARLLTGLHAVHYYAAAA